MVSSRVLNDKTLVALNALENGGLLNSPLANICPLLLVLASVLHVLLGVRGLPSRLPIVCELLKEGRLEVGRLDEGQRVSMCYIRVTRCVEIEFLGQSGSQSGWQNCTARRGVDAILHLRE